MVQINPNSEVITTVFTSISSSDRKNAAERGRDDKLRDREEEQWQKVLPGSGQIKEEGEGKVDHRKSVESSHKIM